MDFFFFLFGYTRWPRGQEEIKLNDFSFFYKQTAKHGRRWRKPLRPLKNPTKRSSFPPDATGPVERGENNNAINKYVFNKQCARVRRNRCCHSRCRATVCSRFGHRSETRSRSIPPPPPISWNPRDRHWLRHDRKNYRRRLRRRQSAVR